MGQVNITLLNQVFLFCYPVIKEFRKFLGVFVRVLSLIILFSVFFIPANLASAGPWLLTNGPEGGSMGGLTFDAANNSVYGFGRGGRAFYQSSTPGSKWAASEVINLPGETLEDLKIDRTDDSVLYVVNGGRIYKGGKAGAWIPKTIVISDEALVSDIFQSHISATTWLAFNRNDSRLFLTIDNMSSWSEISLPASATFSTLYRSNAGVLWLGGFDGSQAPVLYSSSNNGGSWTQKGGSDITEDNSGVNSILIADGDLFVGLRDLDNESFNTVSDNYLFRSSNDGSSFTRLSLASTDTVINVSAGDSDQVVVVSGSYAFRSTNRGDVWADISPDNRRAGDGNIYISPWNSSHLYLSAKARGGILTSTNSGSSWQSNNSGLVNGSPSLVSTSGDINKPNSLISSSVTGEGVFISHDSGFSWQDVSDNGIDHPWMDEITISPHDSDVIWSIADIGNIFVSEDGGTNWEKQLDSQGVGFRYGSIYALATAPNDRSTVYALKNGFGIFKSNNSGSAWEYLNDSLVDYSYSIAVHPSDKNILMSGYNPKPSEAFAKIMRSGNGGQDWVEAERFAGASATTSVQFAAGGSVAYSGVTKESGGELWKSVDTGSNWNITQSSFNFINVRHIVQDANDASHLFALLWGGGIYESTDAGDNWGKLNGLEILSGSISSLVLDPSNSSIMYAGDRLSAKVYRSIDGGVSWSEYSELIGQSRISDITISTDSAYLYVAALGFMGPFSGGFVKIDLSNGLQSDISTGFDGVPLSMTALSSTDLIAVGHGRHAYLSINQGDSWVKLSVTPVDDENFGYFRVVKHPTDVSTFFLVGGDDRNESFGRNNVASSTMHTIWQTINGGSNWTNLNLAQGVPLRDVAISSDGNTLVAVAMNDQMQISEDAGLNWVSLTMPFSMASSVKITGNKAIAVGMLGGGLWTATWASLPTLTWSTGNQLEAPIKNIQVVTHPTDASIAYATGYPGGVYRTEDGGASWRELNDGLPSISVKDPNRQGYYRLAIDSSDGERLLLGLYGKGLFMADDMDDVIWRPINGASHELSGIKLTDILIDGYNWWLATENGIWLSTDGGSNWLRDDNNIPVPDVRTLALGEANQLIAGTRGYELYINDNETGWRQLTGFGNFGVRWAQWDRSLYQYSTLLFDKSDENVIFIGTFPSGIYKSEDKGATWREHNVGWLNDGVFSLIQPFVNDPSTIMAGTYNGINISSDSGASWQTSDAGMPQEQWVFSVASDPFDTTGQTLYAATKNGLNLGKGDTVADVYGTVMKSIDGGSNWNEITAGLAKDQAFYRIIADPNPGMQGRLYLATQHTGVWMTDDGGGTWSDWNNGFVDELWAATNGGNIASTMDISVDGQYLYFGSAGMGIWRRPTFSHIDSAGIIASTDTIDFFRMKISNLSSAEQTFQLSTVGDVAFTLADLALTGDGGIFSIDSSDCGTTLDPLDQCDLIVSVVGSMPGAYATQLSASELNDPIDIYITINGPPVAENQLVTQAEDTTSDISADITDVNSDGLSLSLSINPNSGNVGVNVAGDGFVYTPNSNFNGMDSFTYIVSDGLESDTATVSITIDAVNDLPTLNQSVLSAVVDIESIYNLQAEDEELGNITFSLVSVSVGASAVVTSMGQLNFTATSAGTFEVVVLLHDDQDTINKTIFITVTLQPQAPAETLTESSGGGGGSFDLTMLCFIGLFWNVALFRRLQRVIIS